MRSSDEAILSRRRCLGSRSQQHNAHFAARVCPHSGYRCIPLAPERPARRELLPVVAPLGSSRSDAVVAVLQSRSARWDADVLEALVGALISFARRRPPLEVLFAALRALSDAWCTAARFGNALVDCLVLCGCHGGDALPHLISCPVRVHWACYHIPGVSVHPATRVASAMRALALPWPHRSRHAAYIDVALWSADQRRNQALAHPCTLFRMFTLLSACLKDLVLRHRAMRDAILHSPSWPLLNWFLPLACPRQRACR